MAGTVTPPAGLPRKVITQGGTQQQAEVAAALVDGIESGGQLNDQNPTSTLSGLFQFLDTTWDQLRRDPVTRATPRFQQQVAKFIAESAGNNFYAWAPDIGGSYNGSGNDSTIVPGSAPVANKIASLNLANPLAGLASDVPGRSRRPCNRPSLSPEVSNISHPLAQGAAGSSGWERGFECVLNSVVVSGQRPAREHPRPWR